MKLFLIVTLLILTGCSGGKSDSSNANDSGKPPGSDPVAPPVIADCSVNGSTVLHEDTVTLFSAASVPHGQTCQSEVRTCDDGALSGSFTEQSCVVLPAGSCFLNGTTLADNDTITAFSTSSVAYGQSCQSEVRTCSNGVLSGTYSESACSVQAAADCSINGTPVLHGNTITLYGSSSVTYGQSCQSEVRTCNNGTLSGSLTVASCSVQAPADCSVNGQTIAHGGTITLFSSSSVPYGQTCQSQLRACNNGSMSGSYTVSSCEVLSISESPLSLEIELPANAPEDSIMYYRVDDVDGNVRINETTIGIGSSASTTINPGETIHVSVDNQEYTGHPNANGVLLLDKDGNEIVANPWWSNTSFFMTHENMTSAESEHFGVKKIIQRFLP